MFMVRLWLNNLLLVTGFVIGGAGSSHGIGPLRRLRLAITIRSNHRKIQCMSSWRQHLMMVAQILRIPKEVEGDVVECGCYNGGTSANLSLACAATGRRLFVCDSFEGLPEPRDDERDELPAAIPWQVTYAEGDLSSEGGVEVVKQNVTRYGDIGCCSFVKGFFSDSLPKLEIEKVVFVFEDADLRSSIEDCIRVLWPKMQEGSRFYCHEPYSPRAVSLFYDDAWWEQNVGTLAPGFFGSGTGIIEVLLPSRLGFAWKLDAEKAKRERQRLDLHQTREGKAAVSTPASSS